MTMTKTITKTKANLILATDNHTLASEITTSLERLGYNVCDIVDSGGVALEKAMVSRPDLLLIDTDLCGKLDGIKAAMLITNLHEIPVLFLAASDLHLLERSKLADPYCYIVKPFEERLLEINISFSLYRAKVRKEQQETESRLIALSFTDRLTNMYNRAFFEMELNRLDDDESLPLSVIVGDANGLKLVNDAFGHREGDQLLVKLAQVMKRSCRKTDIIARWGGDEFAILLPKTTYRETKEILYAIKDACAQEEAKPIELSIALGCATKEVITQDLEEIVKRAEGDMYSQKLSEAKDFRNSIIASLIRTLGEKDYETEEHAWRMQSLAIQLGSVLELSDEEMNDLVMAVTLHDIGKIAVPEEILTKPGFLTADERKIINEHSERGYRITVSSDELSRIAPIVLSHHERWDGKGYPQRLKEEEIPLLARIISIVDTYDVMTNSRPYKKAVGVSDALDELRRCSGSQFDPNLVKIFLTLF